MTLDMVWKTILAGVSGFLAPGVLAILVGVTNPAGIVALMVFFGTFIGLFAAALVEAHRDVGPTDTEWKSSPSTPSGPETAIDGGTKQGTSSAEKSDTETPPTQADATPSGSSSTESDIDPDEAFEDAVAEIIDAREADNPAKQAIDEEHAFTGFIDRLKKVGRSADTIPRRRQETYAKVIADEAEHLDPENVSASITDALQSKARKPTSTPSTTSTRAKTATRQSASASTTAGASTTTSSSETTSKRRTEKQADSHQNELLGSAVIGAVVTMVVYFIPLVNAIAPSVGGFVAGYRYERGIIGGMQASSLHAVILALPTALIALIAGGALSQVPIIGNLLAGSAIVVAVAVIVHALITGFVPGIIGGAMAGHSNA